MSTETTTAAGQTLAIKYKTSEGTEMLLVASVVESYPTKANAGDVSADVLATIESLEAMLATAAAMPVAPMSPTMSDDGQHIKLMSDDGQHIKLMSDDGQHIKS